MNTESWFRGLAVLVLLIPACAADSEGDDASSTGSAGDATASAGPGDELPPLPPPIAEACGAGELPDDQLCFQACPADVGQVEAGLQVDCDVTEIATAADGTTLEVDLPPCGDGGVLPPGAAACFTVVFDDGLGGDCFEDGWQVQIAVTRAEGSDAGCRIEPRCKLSQNRAIDCPDISMPPESCGDGWCVLSEGCSECPQDCGVCGDYSSCGAESECEGSTPHCATPAVFENGGGMCTVACDEFHLCPEFVETGTRASCLDGACVLRCEGDEDCPDGMGCVDLGPIEASGSVFVCMP